MTPPITRSVHSDSLMLASIECLKSGNISGNAQTSDLGMLNHREGDGGILEWP